VSNLENGARATNHASDVMNRLAKKLLARSLVASLALSTFGAGAAHAAASQEGLLPTMAIPATPDRARVVDQLLQTQIENALLSDPYFYSGHVTVSVKNGIVFLEGFVFSDWDLRDAIRIATKAANGGRVVDNLAIEVGGRR
jgi:osmotically-inducible protein OsmY